MRTGQWINKGCDFILSPPAGAEIDFTRLVIQWFIVALVAGVFLFILKSIKGRSIDEPGRIATNHKESKMDIPQHIDTEQKKINIEARHVESIVKTTRIIDEKADKKAVAHTKSGIIITEKPAQEVKQIRPWIRYWARAIDNYLFITVISYPFGYLIGSVFPSIANDAAKNPKGAGFVFALIMIFIWVFVESFLLTTLGTTPGKWLLNIRVTNSTGGTLFFFEAIYRSFSVWIKGLCMGLPIFSLITFAVAHNKLTKDGITTWDKRGEFVVSHKKIGAVRVIVFLLIFMALAIFTQVISEKYKRNANRGSGLSSYGYVSSYDYERALKEGYTDKEIANYLASKGSFDIDGARDDGYSDKEIIQYLSQPKPPTPAVKIEARPAAPEIIETNLQDTRSLAAKEWIDKAAALRQDEKFTDPKKAIEFLNKAIRLKPDYGELVIFAVAHLYRGFAYDQLGQYRRSIEDYNEVIRLRPAYAEAYNNRGLAYLMIKDTSRGCKDAQKAYKMGSRKAYEWAKNAGLCQ